MLSRASIVLFSKIKPIVPISSGLSRYSYKNVLAKIAAVPLIGGVGYFTYSFYKKKQQQEQQRKQLEEEQRYYEQLKELQKKKPINRSFWMSIWSKIAHIIRFFHLLIVFTPAIILSPLLFFKKTQGYWLDIFVKSVERAGVVFIKAFQYLSHRRDIIGPQLATKFEYLRQQAPTHSLQTTKKYFRKYYGRELSDIFQKFQQQPIASGSVSQVYRAIYKGKKVAVKVRHPDVQKYIQRDVNLLFFLSKIVSYFQPATQIPISQNSLKKTLIEQIDFTFQMRNLNKFNKMFKQRNDVNFPEPYRESTKDSVLVQTFIEGIPITYYETNKHPLNKVIARLGSQVLFQMLMKNNFVHADCHGGNIIIQTKQQKYNFFTQIKDFVTDLLYIMKYRVKAQTLQQQKIKKLYLQYCEQQTQIRKLMRKEKHKIIINLIDAGMVIKLNQTDKKNFVKFIKSVIECKGEQSAQMIYSLSNYQGKKLGQKGFQNYKKQLYQCFDRLNNNTYSNLQGMVLLWDMLRIIRQNKMKLDGQFATLLTNIVVLQGIARDIDPQINILKCAFPYFKYAEQDNSMVSAAKLDVSRII